MAKVKMKRIELCALLSDSKKIIERLQRRGLVELCSCEDERLIKINTSSNISQLDKSVNTAQSALEILDTYAPQSGGLFSKLNGRRAIEKHDFGRIASNIDEFMRVCYDVVSLNKEIQDDRNEISRLNISIDYLFGWKDFDVPLKYTETSQTHSFIGTFPFAIGADEIELQICNDQDKDIPVDVEIISSFKNITYAMITCHNDDKEKVYDRIRNSGFTYPQSLTDVTPKNQIEIYSKRISSLETDIGKNIEIIKAYRDKTPNIEFAIDYLTMKKDKYEALNEIGMTKHTLILSGYIPEKYAVKLAHELEKRFISAVIISEPTETDDVPVLLSNGKFSEPVEGITEMYALPNKRDVDPSPVMAFFYYLFFGMMLSDAGYGIIMVIAIGIILKKFTVEDPLKRTLKMFFYCGISTTIWGILFGSWFGDIVQVVGKQFFGKEIGSIALWFQPLDRTIDLLLFSFALGICHLFLGLAVNFKILWCEKKKIDAVCDVIPVYITILGVAPLGASILTTVPKGLVSIGTYIAAVGVILIVLTSGRSSKNIFMRFFGGIYGLYNIATGYLSDILSYSRLLALGLATGSIAGVINLIATMPENIALKTIMLIVVFPLGHIANLAINLLGAYVHSDRLQFVELFSKFYEGGGRAFKPLKVNTKYVKFEEESFDE